MNWIIFVIKWGIKKTLFYFYPAVTFTLNAKVLPLSREWTDTYCKTFFFKTSQFSFYAVHLYATCFVVIWQLSNILPAGVHSLFSTTTIKSNEMQTNHVNPYLTIKSKLRTSILNIYTLRYTQNNQRKENTQKQTCDSAIC